MSRSICPSYNPKSNPLVITCSSLRNRIFFFSLWHMFQCSFPRIKFCMTPSTLCLYLLRFFWLFCFYHLFDCYRIWGDIRWFQLLYELIAGHAIHCSYKIFNVFVLICKFINIHQVNEPYFVYDRLKGVVLCDELFDILYTQALYVEDVSLYFVKFL